MIPLCLITGFLGSGKTTLLKRLAGCYREQRVVFLVNEFSEVDIDGRLVQLPEGELLTISGGSIFCHCKAGDFIKHLTAVADEWHCPDQPVEGVIIEATGMADPRVIRKMLVETHLNAKFLLGRVVVIVDPGTFPKLIHTLPAVRAQVETGDLAIINKTDLHEEALVEEIERQLHEMQPGLDVVRAEHCDAEVDPFVPVEERQVAGEYAPSRDPDLVERSVWFDRDVDLNRVTQLLGSLGEGLLRAKGFVPFNGTLHYLDYAAGRLTLTEAEPGAGDPRLVLIATESSRSEFLQVFKQLRDGAAYAE